MRNVPLRAALGDAAEADTEGEVCALMIASMLVPSLIAALLLAIWVDLVNHAIHDVLGGQFSVEAADWTPLPDSTNFFTAFYKQPKVKGANETGDANGAGPRIEENVGI
jgi:hypothetical protein